MKRCLLLLALLLALLSAADAERPEPPRSRTFLFTYAATVNGVPAGKTARIWLPVPSNSQEQDVRISARELPGSAKAATEPQYGNDCLYVEAQPDADGKIKLQITYHVTRREVRTAGDGYKKPAPSEKLSRFLEPDAKVPISGKPLTLVQGRKLPEDQLAMARVFYDVVNQHMRYSKEGIGWGQGDAVWACDSRYGNCSDFHSLFISLARAHKVPAKFEIGFPLPAERGEGTVGGYHCWAWFLPAGRGWVPVDISEANKEPALKEYYFGNLTENRVTFSTGRDLELVPRQSGPPLNFFIYPYVEVDGQPLPQEKIEKSFKYRDVQSGR
jgi:transglutaminase-like putative cysteine protease